MDIQHPNDEPDWDERVVAHLEGRTIGAMRTERCRSPERHPPFYHRGRLVRYIPSEYRRWKAEQLAAERARVEAKAEAQELADQVLAARKAGRIQMSAIKKLEDAIESLKQALAGQEQEPAE